jgi:hypothetical protein
MEGVMNWRDHRDYDKLRPYANLLAYLDRIGARAKNFKKFVVDEVDAKGYPRSVVEVRLRDGTIECKVSPGAPAGIDYQPTEAELAAIEAELADDSIPRLPTSAPVLVLPDSLDGVDLSSVDPSHYYVYRSQDGSSVLMIQWRKDGRKPDWPYSYWSDGVWRNMEPDEPLPLYGLDQIKGNFVMIHEGAKTAQYIQALCDDRDSRHPWVEGLRGFKHLGWPGGVHRAGDVDWEPIKRLGNGATICIVCDRDVGGESVISRISRRLQGQKVMALMFDERFPRPSTSPRSGLTPPPSRRGTGTAGTQGRASATACSRRPGRPRR